MNDVGRQILALITSKRKSVVDMTRPLKIIGGGSMETGINRLAEYMLKKGIIKGAVGGVVGGITLTIIIIALIKLFKENKKLKEEEKLILKELEDGLSDVMQNDSVCDCTTEEQIQGMHELLDDQK